VAALATDARGRLATDLGLKDTVLVWPGESVRIAIRFDIDHEGPQTYLFHCHNMEHEDGGMMLGVRVA
jgi:suppressor of ftsI/bilirubin oxidase